jgi:tetratricopeptide (TPR) repeat protein
MPVIQVDFLPHICPLVNSFYWANKQKVSETLFRHALEVTENNYIAHNNLGVALDKEGPIDEVITQLRESIRLKPDHVEAHYNLGIILLKEGQIGQAIRQFQEAVRLKSDYADARRTLEAALTTKPCPNLANHTWYPVRTNTVNNGSIYFSDPQWTNYPNRIYRIRSP